LGSYGVAQWARLCGLSAGSCMLPPH